MYYVTSFLHARLFYTHPSLSRRRCPRMDTFSIPRGSAKPNFFTLVFYKVRLHPICHRSVMAEHRNYSGLVAAAVAVVVVVVVVPAVVPAAAVVP